LILFVDPQFRNRGMAKALMRFLMNRSHELGLKELVLFSEALSKSRLRNGLQHRDLCPLMGIGGGALSSPFVKINL
jgi:GNAT superfamily N-acetyltransferase